MAGMRFRSMGPRHAADLGGAPEGQWPLVAKIWRQLGPPLRPVGEDLSFFESALSAWCRDSGGRPPRGLILGVTPELYWLPWPDRSMVRAADRSPEMIRWVWPGSPSAVAQTNWAELRGPARSVDIVFCDGGLHLLDYPRGQAAWCRSLGNLVAPGGLVAIRLFTPPPSRETPGHVLSELHAGEVPNLNCLKLRLGPALQESPQAGVALKDVWLSLRGEADDWAELAGRLGWPLEHLSVIDAYRDSEARYHFVSVAEARALFCETTGGAFELVRVDTPSYELGGQCPTLLFRHVAVGEASADG